MKKFFPFWVGLMLLVTVSACGSASLSREAEQADTLPHVDTVPLPDTMYASVDKNMKWEVLDGDTTSSGIITDFVDPYDMLRSHLAFRGNQLRNADFGGKVTGVPKEIVQDWVYTTPVSTMPTSLGVWGGGTGLSLIHI